MSTYKRISALATGLHILEFLAQQREPAIPAAIAAAVEAPVGTVMCHLATLEDRRFARRLGEGWELGLALAAAWARKKSLLEGQRMQIDRDLTAIAIVGE